MMDAPAPDAAAIRPLCPRTPRSAPHMDPRPLLSDGERYDFHRGLDLASPVGTPAFAIADGVVQDAGVKSGYSEPVIIIRHYRPGYSSCSGGGGCFYSFYIHMRTEAAGGCCTVAKDDMVAAGQLLGYTGESLSGFEHVHFELRDAPPEDSFSRWQRDTVHPLGVLPYSDPATVSGTVDVEAVDAQSDTYNVTVMIETTRHDVLGVELSVLDGQQQLVLQVGDTPTATTTWGYSVGPSSFVFQDWSRQWSH